MTGAADRSAAVLERLTATIAARRGAEGTTSYVAKLLARGEDAVLRKVLEEAGEVILASKEGDRLHVIREVADLWFHSLVLLALHDATAADVLGELARREGVSGLSERAARGDEASQ